MRNRLTIAAVALLSAAALSTALAQRLVPPTYYSFNTTILQPGETVTGVLSEEDGQNFKDGSRVHVYFLDGAAGENVQLVLGSDDFDTWLTVYSPDGVVLDWNDDDWEATDYWYSSSLSLTLPADGRYFVIVTAYSQSDLGNYELSYLSGGERADAGFVPESSTPVALGESYLVTLSADMPVTGEGYFGPSQLFELTLDEDTLVVFDGRSETVDSVLILYSADGTLTDWNDTLFDPENPDEYLDSRLMVQLTAGTWYLRLGGYSDYDTGEVTLTLTGYRPLN